MRDKMQESGDCLTLFHQIYEEGSYETSDLSRLLKKKNTISYPIQIYYTTNHITFHAFLKATISSIQFL